VTARKNATTRAAAMLGRMSFFLFVW